MFFHIYLFFAILYSFVIWLFFHHLEAITISYISWHSDIISYTKHPVLWTNSINHGEFSPEPWKPVQENYRYETYSILYTAGMPTMSNGCSSNNSTSQSSLIWNIWSHKNSKNTLIQEIHISLIDIFGNLLDLSNTQNSEWDIWNIKKTPIKDVTFCPLKRNVKDSDTYVSRSCLIYTGLPTEKIKFPNVQTLGICVLPFPISCNVPMAVCTECRFSLQEKTPPAANTGLPTLLLELFLQVSPVTAETNKHPWGMRGWS